MKKRDELAMADSCLNKAADDELIFVLLGRDMAAPTAIRAWAEERVRLRKNAKDDTQIVEVLDLARSMLHGAFTPARRGNAFFLDKVSPELAEEIDVEVARAERHGLRFASLHEAYAVILEELDEVWEIARNKRLERNEGELRKEFIQIAAMAVKAIQSLDNFVGGTV